MKRNARPGLLSRVTHHGSRFLHHGSHLLFIVLNHEVGVDPLNTSTTGQPFLQASTTLTGVNAIPNNIQLNNNSNVGRVKVRGIAI